MPKKMILFSLQTFSTTGGVQKMTRTLSYSLQQLSLKEGWDFELWSLHDSDSDLMRAYIRPEDFKGFSHQRAGFFIKSLKAARQADVVIVSHIHLALLGLLAKLLHPSGRVWLIAHGIEVWRPLTVIRKAFMKCCDRVICVSSFTRQEVIRWHGSDPDQCLVLNNALDPLMPLPADFARPPQLLQRYGLTPNQPVIFTLSRLVSTEQYKGHEQVIRALGALKGRFPEVKYLISGSCDASEEKRIRALAKASGVEDQVVLTGFIKDEELTDHFLLADLFVLPSRKEGFGIVLVEALACGLPVICGNGDGSMDAIRQGELGEAVDPDDGEQLEQAIARRLCHPLSDAGRRELQSKCLAYFSEAVYRARLRELIGTATSLHE